MVVVSCLLCYMARLGAIAVYARTQEKGQALTYRGVLSLAGVIYFAQFKQIGIYI